MTAVPRVWPMRFDMPYREKDRLAALNRYAILDTPPEDAFDRVTRLACRLFDVPMSTVTLIDAHRQWFKSRQGVEACATPREPALCDRTIRLRDPLVIPDTHADPQFRDNPLVTGGPRIRFYAGITLRTVEGHAIGTICVMDTRPRRFKSDDVAALNDLAGIVMSELELRRLAMTDALTGALSRRAFYGDAARILAQARQSGRALALVMFDLDHFKAINDRHGHAAGDSVLVATAEACRRVLHERDILGRVGGEEFAVLLPQTDLDEAERRAEALRSALAQVRVATPGGPIGITASFGVASLDDSTADLDVLLKRADGALYVAKRSGRNRCVTQSQDLLGQDTSGDAALRGSAVGPSLPARSFAFTGAGPAHEGALRAG